jgi:hypothetical protein
LSDQNKKSLRSRHQERVWDLQDSAEERQQARENFICVTEIFNRIQGNDVDF